MQDGFYQIIESFGGAHYFDPNYSQPFTYVGVLFCCQRFDEAMQHLWACKKRFAAAQFTVLLLHYGLRLPWTSPSSSPSLLPLDMLQRWLSTCPPTFLKSVSDILLVIHNAVREQLFLHLVDAHIVEVFKRIQQQFLMDLWGQYFHRIVKLKRGGAENSRDCIHFLVGASLDDGMRNCRRAGGYLDKFTASVFAHHGQFIDEVLFRTANAILVEISGDTVTVQAIQDAMQEEAMYLLMLVGRYGDLLAAMCRCCMLVLNSIMQAVIASYGTTPGGLYQATPPADMIAQITQDKWIQLSRQFYAKYLENGYGMVVRELQSNRQEEILFVFETMLRLVEFCVNAAQNKWVDALSIIDSMGMLPTKKSDVLTKAEMLMRTHKFLRALVGNTLLLSVKCTKSLVQAHVMAKRGLTPTTQLGDTSVPVLSERALAAYQLSEMMRGQGGISSEIALEIHTVCNSITW